MKKLEKYVCEHKLIDLGRVFYNPDNQGEVTIIGQIWIVKVLIIWGLMVVIAAFPVFIAFYWFVIVHDSLGSSHARRVEKYGWCTLIIVATLSLIAMFGIFCIGVTFALPLCEIILFSPMAYVMYQASHDNYVHGMKSIVAKKSFDFILDNKSLYINETVFGKSYHAIQKSKREKNENKNKKEKEIENGENDNENEKQRKKEDIDDSIYEMYKDDESISIVDSSKILSKYKVNARVLKSEQEKCFRLAFINYCFLHFFKFDSDVNLKMYLEKDEIIDSEWKGVTLEQIGKNATTPKPGNFESLVTYNSE